MDKKFLQQVYGKIEKPSNLEMKLRDDCIEFIKDEDVISKVDDKGGLFYYADIRESNLIDILYDKVNPVVREVKEYLSVMNNAPELKALDFDMPYKKIVEFNGVVLGGIEHTSGEFEFTTWETEGKSLYHGHYFRDYSKAKEDFAVRCGLVNQNKMFTDEEMIEIYRCSCDTLNGMYELTDKQTEIIEEIRNKVKDSICNFDKKLSDLENEQEETIQDQTM
jgi:hypothetical protein